MEARCAHCFDTGSLSKQMDADLDCHYCEATEKRRKLRTHLAQFTAWPDNDTVAWAAYLFAQRQAAPVAQPAQQVEVPECGACHGTGWTPRDVDIGTEQECFSCDGSGDGEVTTSQLQAQKDKK
jgi:cytochrome c553